MTISEFVSAVERNGERVRDYALGGDGSDGGCDCIGLIIGALRLCGVAWGGTHGTNYAKRYRMRTFHPVGEGVRRGELVYKSRAAGEKGYSLPQGYQTGSDLADYYHVGVVVSTDPVQILHVTKKNGKGGLFRDSGTAGWQWAGMLKGVEEGRRLTITLAGDTAEALLAALKNAKEENA